MSCTIFIMQIFFMDIAQFYSAVIDDFTKRLRDQLSQKEQGLDEEVVDQMKSLIRQRMQHPQDLFTSATTVKHSSIKTDLPTSLKKDFEESKVKKQEESQSSSEQNDFDLFQKPSNLPQNLPQDIDIIKKEEVSPQEQSQKQEPPDEEDRFEEENREHEEEMKRVKQNVEVHVLGMYEKKRHVAKDQQTKLDLENVFLKNKNKGEEIFYSKMHLELTNV